MIAISQTFPRWNVIIVKIAISLTCIVHVLKHPITCGFEDLSVKLIIIIGLNLLFDKIIYQKDMYRRLHYVHCKFVSEI